MPEPIRLDNPRNARQLLPEIDQQQAAERDETSQYNTIPPLLRSYSPYQSIDARYLTRSPYDPPIDTCQCLSLHAEILIYCIGLIYDTIDDAVAVVYPPALL